MTVMKLFLILLTISIEWNTNTAQGQQVEKSPSTFRHGRKHQPTDSDPENRIYFNGKQKVLRDSDLAVLQNMIPNQPWKTTESKFQRAAKAAETGKMLSIDLSSLGGHGIKLGNSGGRHPALMDVDVSVLSKGLDHHFPLSKSVSHMTESLNSPYDRLTVPVEGKLLNPRHAFPKPNTERNDVAVFQLPIRPINLYHSLFPETKKGDQKWQPLSLLMKFHYPPFFYFPVVQRNTQRMLEIMTPKHMLIQPADILSQETGLREHDKLYAEDDYDNDDDDHEQEFPWKKDFQISNESSEEITDI